MGLADRDYMKRKRKDDVRSSPKRRKKITFSNKFKNWFYRRRYYYKLRVNDFIHDIVVVLVGIFILYVVQANFSILNKIEFWFIQLGTVIALVLLYFILKYLYKVLINLKYAVKGSTNGSKLIFVFLCLILIVGVSACSNISPLEPITKQIESFNSKSGFTSARLLVGDTGIVNDVAITPVKYEIHDNYSYVSRVGYITIGRYDIDIEEVDIVLERKYQTVYLFTTFDGHTENKFLVKKYWEEKGSLGFEVIETINPPTGAKLMFVYIKVKNIGEQKRSFPNFGCSFNEPDIYLKYKGVSMDIYKELTIEGVHFFSSFPEIDNYFWCEDEVYPGVSEEGWIVYEVPTGIELEDTTLEIKGLVWNFK